ncbi:MAG: site-2 protease family protein [Spirochaetales bacterium]|nr:site-2 protease family protein [Spirochaetales bacterium]
MLLTIFIGIIGLDIVVLVHEIGHLLVAKLMGISVEAFSVGMGKKLFSLRYGETEYRLSLFPIGGYCKMKGEEQFTRAIREKSNSISHEDGSIFSASPLRRIATYLAGPLFNILFAIIVLSIIWFTGFTINTYSNRIVLLSDYPEIFLSEDNPADIAGLHTGDKIVQINYAEISNYSDLQEIIYASPGKKLSIEVERDSRNIVLEITPRLNNETGAGQIGVSPWIDPLIERVEPGSSAFIGGLEEGDYIISANGIPVENYLDIFRILSSKPEYLKLSVLRGKIINERTLVPVYNDDGNVDLGLVFRSITVTSENLNIPEAVAKGTIETVNTFIMTAKSIYLLFRGVDVKKAVSGPIRISYYVGEIASSSFREGIKRGFTTIFRFLSIISIALGFANLLPIPIFDGGLILFTSIELIRRKPLRPGIFYRYQSIGFFIIIIIFFFTTYSDISFLFSK